MQQRNFIIIVIVVNSAFLLLQFDKSIRSQKLMSTKAALERTVAQLNKKYEQLSQELCFLQHHDTIREYAVRYLHMRPLTVQRAKNRNELSDQILL